MPQQETVDQFRERLADWQRRNPGKRLMPVGRATMPAKGPRADNVNVKNRARWVREQDDSVEEEWAGYRFLEPIDGDLPLLQNLSDDDSVSDRTTALVPRYVRLSDRALYLIYKSNVIQDNLKKWFGLDFNTNAAIWRDPLRLNMGRGAQVADSGGVWGVALPSLGLSQAFGTMRELPFSRAD